jgi:hypothetical protein
MDFEVSFCLPTNLQCPVRLLIVMGLSLPRSGHPRKLHHLMTPRTAFNFRLILASSCPGVYDIV